MKAITFARTSSAAILLASSPVVAGPTNHAGMASSVPAITFAQWTKRIQGELNRNLEYPTGLFGREPAAGEVRIKFNCSDSGRPDKVSLQKSSGSSALDGAALRAVQHIVTLHPLPDGFGHDRRYVAVVLFDIDAERMAKRQAAVGAEVKRLNAWYKAPVVAAQNADMLIAAW